MIVAFLAAAVMNTCSAIPGLAATLSGQTAKLIWVGEYHGTSEQPAIFSDIVCTMFMASGKPIAVTLERSKHEQVSWDRYLEPNPYGLNREGFSSAA